MCLLALCITALGGCSASLPVSSVGIVPHSIETTLEITVPPTEETNPPIEETQPIIDEVIVPTEETEPSIEEIIPSTEATMPDTGIVYLGLFKLTAYCPCTSCSGRWGTQTSTGVTAQVNHTVAVDPTVINYGTKLIIGDWDVVYVAEDCGKSVKGNIIDIYFATHEECVEFGVQYAHIYMIVDEN